MIVVSLSANARFDYMLLHILPEGFCRSISIGNTSFDTSVKQPEAEVDVDVEPDEEGLVVRLELDLKQGRVHPQGENVLPPKYHCIT